MLARIREIPYDGDEHSFTPEQRHNLIFEDNRMYFHKSFRINYTTYDLRRAHDTINPRNQANIMMLSRDEDEHPYWYARVLKIFNVGVRYTGCETPDNRLHYFNVLWIRWYGREAGQRTGWKHRRLHRIDFIDGESDDTPMFGFLDPELVIRGIHLIPAFARGFKEHDSVNINSIAREHDSKESREWNYYYISQ